MMIMIPDGLAFPNDMIQNKPNCGLLAITVATGASLADATNAYLAAEGRKRDGRWGGRTYWEYTLIAIENLKPWTYRGRGKPNCNVYNFLKNHTRKDVLYIIRVRGHVFAAKNGWVFDQNGAMPANKSHRLMRKHVQNFVEEIV